MELDKKLAIGVLHYHISRQALEKLLKLGTLSESEFNLADKFLYERYNVDKSIVYNHHTLRLGSNNAGRSDIKPPIVSDDSGYLSLTDVVCQHGNDKLGYAIQSWL